MLKVLFPDFPAYATFADKLGWYALRLGCIAILLFLLLPIAAICGIGLYYALGIFLVADIGQLGAALVKEYKERYEHPYIAAAKGYIDDVIDPAETRIKLIASLEVLRTKREDLPNRKHGNMPL